MLGRLLGGIATSLLFSVFESWLVAEHFHRGYDDSLLSQTFSKAVFFGNGLVAILSGLVGNLLVESMAFGPVAPFDAAATLLVIGAIVICYTWTENYGNSDSRVALQTQFSNACEAMRAGNECPISIFFLG